MALVLTKKCLKIKVMKVKIVNKSNNPLPQYSTPQSAGIDLRAFTEQPITLKPLDRALIPTGLFMELPAGFEAQVRPRSGLAIKNGPRVRKFCFQKAGRKGG